MQGTKIFAELAAGMGSVSIAAMVYSTTIQLKINFKVIFLLGQTSLK